jgi:hypothetical protein
MAALNHDRMLTSIGPIGGRALPIETARKSTVRWHPMIFRRSRVLSLLCVASTRAGGTGRQLGGTRHGRSRKRKAAGQSRRGDFPPQAERASASANAATHRESAKAVGRQRGERRPRTRRFEAALGPPS